MIPRENVEELIGYTACGASNNAIKLTVKELEKHSKYIGWVDVCKGWNKT